MKSFLISYADGSNERNELKGQCFAPGVCFLCYSSIPTHLSGLVSHNHNIMEQVKQAKW